MQIDRAAAAGAAAAVALITVGVVMRTLNADPHGTGKGVIVRFPDGGAAVGTKCITRSAWVSDGALKVYGLSPDAGHWVRARVCARPDTAAFPNLPAGMVAVEDPGDMQEDWAPGQHQLEAWQAGDPGDPSPCACSSGANCEKLFHDIGGSVRWGTAPKNETLREFRGAGCIPKTCTELLGYESSMPGACK